MIDIYKVISKNWPYKICECVHTWILSTFQAFTSSYLHNRRWIFRISAERDEEDFRGSEIEKVLLSFLLKIKFELYDCFLRGSLESLINTVIVLDVYCVFHIATQISKLIVNATYRNLMKFFFEKLFIKKIVVDIVSASSLSKQPSFYGSHHL